MIHVRAAVAVATGATAVYVWLRQVETEISAPESIWPTTVVGWVGALLSLVAVVGVFYSLHRFSQKPVLAMIADLHQELKDLQEHYDERLEAVQKHYDGEVERLIETQTREIQSLAKIQAKETQSLADAVTKDINGWSTRITETARRLDDQRVILDGLLLDVRESRTNGEHVKHAIDRIQAYLLGGLEAVQKLPPPTPPKRGR